MKTLKISTRRNICLAALLVIAMTLASVSHINRMDVSLLDQKQINTSSEKNWSGEEEDVPSCTYEQLSEAFGTTTTTTTQDDGKDDTCWSLFDHILRVPQTAILNFKRLIPLGAGCKGGVFKIFLDLDHGHTCVAAYKTDLRNTHLCHDAWRHPFEQPFRTKSCISAHMRPRKTSMGGEYTGALPFYAEQKIGRHLPGLLPTWAIVPDERGTATPKFLRSKSVPEPILGVIMPFTPITALKEANMKELAPKTNDLAKLMLSAADALAFIHELGFAHQDILPNDFKNVGITQVAAATTTTEPTAGGDDHTAATASTPAAAVKTTPQSIIFDYGYLAFEGNKNEGGCNQGRACDYCWENVFPSPRMKNAIDTDFERFRQILLTLLQDAEDPANALNMQDSLGDCQNMRDIVSILQEHSL